MAWASNIGYCLVVTGTMEWIITFHSVGNFIIPTDELHHFSEGYVYHQPGYVGVFQTLDTPKIRRFRQAPHHDDETALPRFPCRVLEEDVCAGRDPAVVGWGYPAEYHEDMMGI